MEKRCTIKTIIQLFGVYMVGSALTAILANFAAESKAPFFIGLAVLVGMFVIGSFIFQLAGRILPALDSLATLAPAPSTSTSNELGSEVSGAN